MTPDPLCERCGVVPAARGDWMHCEECYQIVCNEIHEAWVKLREGEETAERDEIGRLMETLDLSFVEAVEMLAVERHGMDWLRSQQEPPA
jgi:hypothetical protein